MERRSERMELISREDVLKIIACSGIMCEECAFDDGNDYCKLAEIRSLPVYNAVRLWVQTRGEE